MHHSSYLQFIFLGSGRRLFRAGGLFAVGKLLADRWPGLANTHITALIFVNHGMRTVSSADKIVVLKDGAVAEQGSPAQLLHKGGIFAHMVQLQTKSQGWSLVKA